jgi:hypothetical protein
MNRGTPFDVRYVPDSGAKADIAGLPRWAISGLMRRNMSGRTALSNSRHSYAL